jgi:hypothetical protein
MTDYDSFEWDHDFGSDSPGVSENGLIFILIQSTPPLVNFRLPYRLWFVQF